MKLKSLKIKLHNFYDYDTVEEICDDLQAEIVEANLETIQDGGGYVEVEGIDIVKVLDEVKLQVGQTV